MPRLIAMLGMCLVTSPAFADTSYEVTTPSGASDFDEAQCLYGNLEGTPDGITPIDLSDALGDGELSLVEAICLANHDVGSTVMDFAGRSVAADDVTPPTITLNSNNPLVWTQGVPFVDPGAIATDDVDGQVALLGEGTVNTDLPGQATLTYRYTDAAGNAAPPVVRTVNVVAYNQAGPPDASAKLLPNGTGDGYADYATDAFGALTSSECGGGLNADGTPKPLGAAEFDPWSGGLVTDRPRGGVMCNARIYLFALDRSARQIIAAGPNGWSGQGPNNLYPDGTPLTIGVRAADLVAESWIGPDAEVRRTRFFPHLFPGLQVDLDQRASCAALTQVYRFTNVGPQSISFRLTQVADSDLGFGGNFTQNYGRWDTQDPYTSWVYNNAKDVGLMMRSRVDFDTDFEGWRVKLQGSAGWDHLRAGMYYGFPTAGFDVARCEANATGTNCPTPDHLNKVFASLTGSHPDNYYISPDGASNVESNNDPDGDGWSNARWDVDQVLQSVYVLAPGESREYRTLYEGLPSYCQVQTDAGFDHVVAVAAGSACAATVDLDGGESTVAGNATADTTYTWYDEDGAVVGDGVSVQATVVGAGEHRFDLKVCNGDGICDTDFVVVFATDDDGTCADTDGDGFVDAIDLDDDDDGIADVAEAAADTDDDGHVDGHDLDSDGDGIPDLLEGDDVAGIGASTRDALVDVDRDGQIDLGTKVDPNDNGWDDRFEDAPPTLPDFDDDGTPDVRDRDDDGDLIPTSLECPDRRPCPVTDGQPDYLNVAEFACQALGVATANGLLGAGGAGNGNWFVGTQSFSAVARDGFTGHLYALNNAGVLWRVTPGAEFEIGPTGLTNPVALTASPYPGVLVAASGGATSTFYDIAIATGIATQRDTVDGNVGDVTFDAAGRRVYSRTLAAQHQLVFVDRTVVTASLVHGLAVRAGGTVIGLVQPDANTLRVVAIAANGAFTALYEPTRSWRPGIAPAGSFDFAGCQANRAPTLLDDAAITPYQTAVTVTPLANDNDDGAIDPTSLVVGTPSGGSAVATASDVLVTPPSGFVGAVTFDYTVEDDANLTGTATVTVYVAPDAQPDTHTRAQGGVASTLALATNDVAHASSTYALIGAPAWATLSGSTLTLAPAASVSGTFTFAYDNCYATPIGPACDRAAVSIVINAAPSLSTSIGGTGSGGPAVTLDVATIYSDPEGHALDAASITTTAPTGCIVTVTRVGSVLSAAPGSAAGVCDVAVRACDAAAPPACGTTAWTVTVNDPPVGTTLTRTVGTDTTVTWDLEAVLAGVQLGIVNTDVDRTRLSVVAVGAAGTTAVTVLGGLCSLDLATGRIAYDSPDVTGVDTCRLNVCENTPGAACTVVTFELTVIDSLAPTAEAFVTPVATPLVIPVASLLANDVGVAPATFTLVGVSSGAATLTGNDLVFSPAGAGLVTLTYRVCAAVDPTTCVAVADVIYVRAAPTVAGADLWFATPTASGAHLVTLTGPFPARANGYSTTTPAGASATFSAATVTLTPINPATAATYRTTVTACDAPAVTVPCVGAGPTIAFCGTIAVTEACASADITWTWNDPPTLAPWSISTLPGRTSAVDIASLYVDAGVISGDLDGDGDALDQTATTIVSGPCTIVDSAVQIVAPQSIGPATCTVRLCEERPALAACANTSITIDVLDGATLANDDRYVIAQGDRIDLDAVSGPAANDSVVSGSTFVAGTTDPAAGSIALSTDGALTFDPDATFVGETTFDYTLSDDFGRSDTATVTLVVNDPPELAMGANTVPPGSGATIDLDEVLLSTGVWHGDDPDDGDSDGIDTPTTTGDCSFVAGAFVFAPITSGSGTCTITICEELPAEAPRACTSVSWAITVVLTPVVATDDGYVMAMGKTLTVAAPGVLGNDPTAGTSALIGSVPGLALAADGGFVYTPAADFAGTTQADYRLSDAFGTSATASLTILVNDPPNLQPVTRTMAANATEVVTIDALIVDLGVVFGDDPDDGDEDGIGPVTLASDIDGGPCVVTPEGITLAAPASGSATCELRICEEIPAADDGVCSLVLITIVVPEAIAAANDRYVTLTDTPLTIATVAAGLLGNDLASNGTVDVVDVPGLVLAADGTFVFTPAPGFAGEVVFDYTLVAGAQSTKAVATIIVNDPPTGITSSEEVAAGATTTWTFDALVETFGEVDLGLDPDSVTVTSGPCTLIDGELVLTATSTTTCTVTFCEAEPIDPRACGEATVTVTITTEPPLDEDAFLASGGGGCAGGGASLVLLPLFVWAARRRLDRGRT